MVRGSHGAPHRNNCCTRKHGHTFNSQQPEKTGITSHQQLFAQPRPRIWNALAAWPRLSRTVPLRWRCDAVP